MHQATTRIHKPRKVKRDGQKSKTPRPLLHEHDTNTNSGLYNGSLHETFTKKGRYSRYNQLHSLRRGPPLLHTWHHRCHFTNLTTASQNHHYHSSAYNRPTPRKKPNRRATTTGGGGWRDKPRIRQPAAITSRSQTTLRTSRTPKRPAETTVETQILPTSNLPRCRYPTVAAATTACGKAARHARHGARDGRLPPIVAAWWVLLEPLEGQYARLQTPPPTRHTTNNSFSRVTTNKGWK